MTKIACIGDTHFGCRQDSLALIEYQAKFLRDVFFPTLESEGIDTVVHLGDLCDKRKHINIRTVHLMRQHFIEPLGDRKLVVILGNHDVFHRNSNKVNSVQELLGQYPNIEIVDAPKSFNFGGSSILMVPWICEENKDEVYNAIYNSSDYVLFGHLELNGFEMHRNVYCDHGQDPKSLDKFNLVCSGHFHHKSTYNHINYLGNPWTMTWADYGETKGFHILDTETLELRFIENPYKLFNKIKYNDTVDHEKLFDVDFEQYRDTYVKVIVQERNNPYIFDQFITKLEEADVIDVQVVEDHLNLNLESAEDILNQAESTLDILSNSIKSIQLSKDKEQKLENLVRSLYEQAHILQS